MKNDVDIIEQIGAENLEKIKSTDDFKCYNNKDDNEIEVSIKIRTTTDEEREILFKIEKLFRQLGISFDTGGCNINGGFVRDWEFDWSLTGPIRVYKRQMVSDNKMNRHVRAAVKEKENEGSISQ